MYKCMLNDGSRYCLEIPGESSMCKRCGFEKMEMEARRKDPLEVVRVTEDGREIYGKVVRRRG